MYWLRVIINEHESHSYFFKTLKEARTFKQNYTDYYYKIEIRKVKGE